MKRKMSHNCSVARTWLVTHGTLDLATGQTTEGEKEWRTGPCGSPLFGDTERKTGVCRACARGWEHPNNYSAAYASTHGGPPVAEIDPPSH